MVLKFDAKVQSGSRLGWRDNFYWMVIKFDAKVRSGIGFGRRVDLYFFASATTEVSSIQFRHANVWSGQVFFCAVGVALGLVLE